MGKQTSGPGAKADVIAHPVRLRIIMTVGGRQLTTDQIAAVLSDVPQASLYRHIRRLTEAGVLRVVKEIPVRGTVEKVYALAEGGGRISQEELNAASPEDHVRYFTTFFAAILSWLRSYLADESSDPVADGLTCRGTTVSLSDAEYRELMAEMEALVKAKAEGPPAPDRRGRILGWVSVPQRREPQDPVGGPEPGAESSVLEQERS